MTNYYYLFIFSILWKMHSAINLMNMVWLMIDRVVNNSCKGIATVLVICGQRTYSNSRNNMYRYGCRLNRKYVVICTTISISFCGQVKVSLWPHTLRWFISFIRRNILTSDYIWELVSRCLRHRTSIKGFYNRWGLILGSTFPTRVVHYQCVLFPTICVCVLRTKKW